MSVKKILCGAVAGVSFLFLPNLVSAQPDTVWTKIYGTKGIDLFESVCPTSDGGYVLTGTTDPYDSGRFGVWLIKTDAIGNKQWDTKYAPAYNNNVGNSVIETSDGGFVVAGEMQVTDHSYDMWLLKFDSAGNLLWNKPYGGTGNESGNQVLETPDHGFLVVGYTDSYGLGYHDVWLVKTDSLGAKQWDSTYGTANSDEGCALAPTPDGGYIIAGWSASGAGVPAALLLKVDGLGHEQWRKTYGGTKDDRAFSVLVTPDHGYAVAGWTNSEGAGSCDGWFFMTDSLGNKTVDCPVGGIGWDELKGIVDSPNGGYLTVGFKNEGSTANSDLWLVRFGADGSNLGERTFGWDTTDVGYSIHPTPDGGFVAAGFTGSFGAGKLDGWLMKLAPEVGIAEHRVAVSSGLTVGPNPVNGVVRIGYTLSEPGPVALSVYNSSGELVRSLFHGRQSAGNHRLDWDARTRPSGVYFVRLATPRQIVTGKVVLSR